MKIFSAVIYLLVFNLILVGCKGSSDGEGRDIDNDVLDPNSSLNTVFDGKIFSIPSPIQTSMMIRELDIDFNPNYLNPTDNLSGYNTSYKQALNLGVFGTDLGYVSLYNKSDYSIKYLASIEKITEQLGLTSAFDKRFMKRFESNLANQDSMMILAADAFRKADNFLKNSNRKAISALVLTGGWIESMNLACELNNQRPSQRLVERIGEQQLSLATIIEILTEYNDDKVNDELIQDLTDLQFYFNKVEFKYTYKEPTTDAEKKTTTLNHSLQVKIDTDILNQITMKVRTIRQKITA
jgi:hypothetical protein